MLDITMFHVDMGESMSMLMAAKGKVIIEPFTAWTAIDVDRLYTSEGRVEIKIVARVTPR